MCDVLWVSVIPVGFLYSKYSVHFVECVVTEECDRKERPMWTGSRGGYTMDLSRHPAGSIFAERSHRPAVLEPQPQAQMSDSHISHMNHSGPIHCLNCSH